MKKAIVTGANGFLGRNMVHELLGKGYIVYAIIRNINSLEDLPQLEEGHIHYIKCDMDKYEDLLQYEQLKESLYLFHFAWTGVSEMSATKYDIQLNNVKCACDLLHVASQLKIKRFIFADSIMEYEYKEAIQNDYYKLSLRHTYSIAKNTARNLLQLHSGKLDIEFIPLIISNVYGIGENSSRLVNTAIRNFLSHTHMKFTKGEQLYDFIYISDAVREMCLAAEKGKNNNEYYIGNGKPRPLKEYLQCIRDVVAPDMELILGEISFLGVSLDYNKFDTGSAFDDLGFLPEYTFEQGIRLTAEWIKNQLIC